MDVQKAWTRLLSVQELTFEVRSRAKINAGWNGSGKGVVQAALLAAGVILFQQRGVWTPEGGRQASFSHGFRWTADPEPLPVAHSENRKPYPAQAAVADVLRRVSTPRLRHYVESLAFPRHYVAERKANVRARDLLLEPLRESRRWAGDPAFGPPAGGEGPGRSPGTRNT